MTLRTIKPDQARLLMTQGAHLIDIRDPDEHARVRIGGARNVPVVGLEHVDAGGAPAVIFHCKAGNRTAAHSAKLNGATACDAYLLEGGIDAWRAAGLSVIEDRGAPLEIMRQVQIVAGALLLTGVLLGLLVAPQFLALSAFVGAGLMFAGITGWCGMAKLLARMPWNRAVEPGHGTGLPD